MMDCRVKPGNDDFNISPRSRLDGHRGLSRMSVNFHCDSSSIA
jgi:hypothetical protein